MHGRLCMGWRQINHLRQMIECIFFITGAMSTSSSSETEAEWFKATLFKSIVLTDDISLCLMWFVPVFGVVLFYCSLLLDLQGAHEQASEAYQNAMSTIKSGSDLGAFCLRFLRRCYGSLKGDVPWCNPSSRVFQLAQLSSEFESHVSRVLSILPSKFPLPHDPDQTWISYSGHNQIIDFHMKCLSTDDCILKSFEKFITLMPTNIVLVKRWNRLFSFLYWNNLSMAAVTCHFFIY